jgi:hypothetical protein
MGTDFGLREQVPIDGRLFWALVVFAMAGARGVFGVEERRAVAKHAIGFSRAHTGLTTG